MTAKRLSTLLLAAVLVLGAAACGSSGGGSSTSTTTATQPKPNPAAEKAAVKKAWTTFFSGSAPTAKRVALLQNGSQFSSAIKTLTKNPLASKTSATVSSVTLQGPSKAKVVYTVYLAGTPALKHRTGTAVKTNGQWQVGDGSFCALLKLGGAAPANCPGSS
jgi:hypothetical protein